MLDTDLPFMVMNFSKRGDVKLLKVDLLACFQSDRSEKFTENSLRGRGQK